jgi:putative CocE/NonD family hydrolase
MAGLIVRRLFLLPAIALCLLPLSGRSGHRSGPKDEASPPSYDFRIEDGWLKMRDGVRLAATYYSPVPRSPGERFPVLFEFLPYRKDDGGYIGIYSLYTYFVRRGYILARVDIRGTGSSEGTFPLREYSEQELDDAGETIDQLSRLPGSNGNVGMWGISWGGFNAIQVAMRRPPALKAILAAMATDDLYHDDIHYIDGAFHVDEWAFWFDHSKAIPRSPDYPIDERYYRERFESTPGLLTYLKQQGDGEFWSRNSLRNQYAKVRVPCYLIGGLLDGYRDSIPRMLEKMTVPIKAEVGPWNHAWPDDGTPGPNYEWRREAVRWWDQWLKGRETGVRSDPRLVIYLRAGQAPDAGLTMTPGSWLAGDWPIPGTTWKRFYPAANGRLREGPGAVGADALFYVPSYGISTGLWWGEPTGDMRPDDAGSLVYDGDVLTERFAIVGLPRVRLRVKAGAPLAHWIARLEDVFPDGRVALVAGGLLNGAHRRSRLHPEPQVPGEADDLEFELHLTTWTFEPGHRVRLSVSNSLFPMIWPTPDLMTTTVVTGVEATRIELPIIPAGPLGAPAFKPAEKREVRTDARDLGSDVWPQGTNEWKRDAARGLVTYTWSGKSRYEIRDRRFEATEKNVYETNESDPASSRFLGEDSDRIELRGRTIDVLTSVEIRSDAGSFHVLFVRRILENGRLLRERTWQETIPRAFQ